MNNVSVLRKFQQTHTDTITKLTNDEGPFLDHIQVVAEVARESLILITQTMP